MGTLVVGSGDLAGIATPEPDPQEVVKAHRQAQIALAEGVVAAAGATALA